MPYARVLFDAVFVQHQRIDAQACITLAGEIGLEVAAFREALAGQALRDRVQADAERYAARGAFGVPAFFTGSRMFWGNDRLVLLEDRLRRNR